MTYPIFIFILARKINKEIPGKAHYLFLILSMLGVYFLVSPDFGVIEMGDILALASGFVSALAIMFLREARKSDQPYMILFYLMLFGSVINFIVMLPFWKTPGFQGLLIIMVSTFFALLGQISITIGYKYIDASAGSLVSTARIPIAVILGVLFFQESITIKTLLGGSLVFLSLYLFTKQGTTTKCQRDL
jgi:drug/metabolite transporter (DMT)-like permease